MSYLSATYTYDPENRLASTAGMTYTYDGNGERVLKSNTSGGAAVKRYWSIDGNALAEGDGSGNLTAEYIYFGGNRVARIDLPANTVHYYLSDHLRSTSIVASAAGAVEEESDYYPFGTEVVVTAGPNSYKFTGKERDSESGLDLMGARLYNNALGRFTKPDPLPWLQWQNGTANDERRFHEYISNPQNLGQYTYVVNNPLRFTDPTGLYKCTGTQTQCDNLAAALARAKDAIKSGKLNQKQQAALQKVITFLGKAGDANGVVVKFGPTPKGATAITDSSKVFSVSLTIITFNSSKFSGETEAQRGQVFVHEGQHGIDGEAAGGRNPQTKTEELATERNAYRVQSYAAQGMNVFSPWGLWDPDWKSAAAETNRNASIESNAQQSTAIWCANGGNCK
jgi:RHS repeat-associated protein